MWTVLDPNTHVMTVVGGSLYRYSDEGGHCMQFVPYAQVAPSLAPLSPHFTPFYNTCGDPALAAG